MARPIEETNDIIDKIESVFAVYNKTLNDKAIRIWMEQLERFSSADILKAFDDHVGGKSIEAGTNHSKFAPKPAHILDHLRVIHDRRKSFQKKTEDESTKECDPVIEKAWHVFTTEILGFGILNNIIKAKSGIELSRDQIIEIVNREAAKYDIPDAVPDRYKLDKYWPGYFVN